MKALVPVVWLVNGFVGGLLWATWGASWGNIAWLVADAVVVTLACVAQALEE